ncbi:MAG TPA: MogA/MoaB family molybdenum cofactor biosynthesis protein [Pyrinomonadaceae bacterium]|nr:MogA/MoaB family molybdenum cofactor biosynthesis protein [Pyrinomonadaceae bacterium]
MAEQIRAIVITVSDRRASGNLTDESGLALIQLLQEIGADVLTAVIVPDDLEPLAAKLRMYADMPNVNLIMTTGGTGFSPRDNTPEATRATIEREAPGLAEAMRAETLRQTPTAMISRGVCGIRAGTLIINMPGAPKAVRECFAVIRPVLGHAVTLLAGHSHEEAKEA